MTLRDMLERCGVMNAVRLANEVPTVESVLIKFTMRDSERKDLFAYPSFKDAPLNPSILMGDEPWLDAKIDDRYGGSDDLPPFIVWTNRMIFVRTEYDGMVGVAAYPRHP